METAHRCSRGLALAVFALAPLPFGSLDAVWVALWTVLLALSLVTADYSGIRRGHLLPIGIGLATFAVYASVACLQWTVWDGPFAAPIWSEAARLLQTKPHPRISTIATSPLLTLAPAALFVVAALRAFVMATEEGGDRQIARIIGRAAVAYALYSAASLVLAPHALLWRDKEAYLGNLTGTFINRNTAATYFGSAAIIWLLALIRELRIRSSRRMDAVQNLRSLMRQPPRAGVMALGGFLTCYSAVAATGSRAGFLLTTVLVLLAASLSVDWWSLAKRVGLWRAAAAVGALLVLIEIWGGGVAARIDQRGLADQGRLQVYSRVADIVADYPVFGIGLGAFEAFFPSRRPAELGSAGIWVRAHSTPLEMAVEMGLPAAGLVFAVFAGALVALGRSSLTGRRSSVIAAFCVGLLGLLHSSIDFSLQIPGYAVTFAALMAAGLARLDRPSRAEGHRDDRRTEREPRTALSGSERPANSGSPAG